MSAWVSACGSPLRSCYPSPTSRPSAARITQPTGGLGLVVPSPNAESTMARRIALCSRAEAIFLPYYSQFIEQLCDGGQLDVRSQRSSDHANTLHCPA